MRVFIASIATETNTFAAAPTGAGSFSVERANDPENWEPDNPWRAMLQSLAEESCHEITVGLLADAQPSGVVVREVYEELRDELLEDLRSAMPVDAIMLPLHGAMVADGYPDCEGDILEHIRQLVGPDVAIGVELDPHCHFTERMRSNADIVVAYKEYPHTDVIDRFKEVWQLTLDAAEGRISPVIEMADCRMVGFWHTNREPMQSFVGKMKSMEQQTGILSVSFGHGFPYGDVPEAGAKVWVVGDDNPGAAARLAKSLRDEVWAMRDDTRPEAIGLDEAMKRLTSVNDQGPTVVADVADNAGGGASSDSTFILEALREGGLTNMAIGPVWDLGAIAVCREAGLGARLMLRVGGKCGPLSGLPIDLSVTVRALEPDHRQSILGAGSISCGYSAWVSTDDGTDLVLISRRQQGYATNLFTDLGIELGSKHAIVIKSSHHFYADFAPLAADVLYVTTPGLLRSDFENIPYLHRDMNFWPRIDDPFRTD
ncbi:MAG: M81 family metallopeptidase [Xanthomonadales bacterium]|nr:M81 family metallopeptidase [Xanthomonadales bacterium]